MAKKYVWLKLMSNFFEENYIKLLRRMPDGDKMLVCYLKMQLKSLKDNGVYTYEGLMSSVQEEIALAIDEDESIVRDCISFLSKMGIIELLDDQSVLMIAMQKLIGKESESAERMRKLRQKKGKASHCDGYVTKSDKNVTTEEEEEEETEEDFCLLPTSVEDLFLHFETSCNSTANISFQTSIKKIIDKGMECSVVQKAIDKAARQNPMNPYSYILGILKNWLADGILTIADYKAKNKQDKPTVAERTYQTQQEPTGALQDWEVNWLIEFLPLEIREETLRQYRAGEISDDELAKMSSEAKAETRRRRREEQQE